jgi:OFA family oxalate/formate antiporter-like MFS transporter
MALVGKIVERIGEEKVPAYGSLIFTLSLFSFWFSSSYSILLLSAAFIGFGNGLLTPSAYSSLGEWKPRFRGFMLGFANTIYGLGGIAGSFIAGFTALRFGWRFAFLIYAVIGLIGAILLLKSSIKKSYQKIRLKISYKSLFKKKGVLKAYIGIFLANISFVAILSWYPIYLESLGINVELIGILFALFAVFGSIGSMVIGALSDKFNKDFVISITAIIAAITSIYYVIKVHNIITLLFLSSVLGFTNFPFWALFISIAQSVVRKEESIAVTGLIQNSAIIAAMLAPIIIGALSILLALKLALLIFIPLSLFLTVLITLLLPSKE